MKRNVFLAVLLVFLPIHASAGSCGYQNCWGAVGVGANGEWGFSHSYGQEQGAVNRVYSECPNCTAVETFYNTCGAIALGQNGNYGFGWGDSRAIAEDQAMSYCWETSSTCAVQVWACSK